MILYRQTQQLYKAKSDMVYLAAVGGVSYRMADFSFGTDRRSYSSMALVSIAVGQLHPCNCITQVMLYSDYEADLYIPLFKLLYEAFPTSVTQPGIFRQFFLQYIVQVPEMHVHTHHNRAQVLRYLYLFLPNVTGRIKYFHELIYVHRRLDTNL